YRRARRHDLVYRLRGVELRAVRSLRNRSLTSDPDGRDLGDPDRCATRFWHLLTHVFRSHGKTESRALAVGVAFVLRDWSGDGARRGRSCISVCGGAVGLLPPRKAALRVHGALQEEER